ncbi:MAG: hypothetical protein ACMUEM_00505 [Flavobacteriales bacterium AspAUS03]
MSDIRQEDRSEIQGILNTFGIITYMEWVSPIRKHSMVYLTLNTCPLALAEWSITFLY